MSSFNSNSISNTNKSNERISNSNDELEITLLDLPWELLVLGILSHLSLSEIAAVERTCKYLQIVLNSNASRSFLWKKYLFEKLQCTEFKGCLKKTVINTNQKYKLLTKEMEKLLDQLEESEIYRELSEQTRSSMNQQLELLSVKYREEEIINKQLLKQIEPLENEMMAMIERHTKEKIHMEEHLQKAVHDADRWLKSDDHLRRSTLFLEHKIDEQERQMKLFERQKTNAEMEIRDLKKELEKYRKMNREKAKENSELRGELSQIKSQLLAQSRFSRELYTINSPTVGIQLKNKY